MAEGGLLCFVQIFKNGTSGTNTIEAIFNTKPLQRGCAKMLEQFRLCGMRIEIPAWPLGNNSTCEDSNILNKFFCFRFKKLAAPLRQQAFFRCQPEQFIENLFLVKFLQEEMAGRYIYPAYRRRSGTEIDGA